MPLPAHGVMPWAGTNSEEGEHMRREVRNGRLCAVIAIVLLVVVASLSLAGCAGSSGDAGGTWTVALYLCGSNLESKQGWATKTLEEIAGANMPANVRVVVH